MIIRCSGSVSAGCRLGRGPRRARASLWPLLCRHIVACCHSNITTIVLRKTAASAQGKGVDRSVLDPLIAVLVQARSDIIHNIDDNNSDDIIVLDPLIAVLVQARIVLYHIIHIILL